MRDIYDIKEAFDTFDTDKSGYIEKQELSALSAELGELLDDDELTTAFSQINVAQDGKIHFSEFINWWTKENRSKGSEKTGAKLAIIKSKLNAKFIVKFGNSLLRRLSELKIDNSAKDHELVKYRIGFSVGDASAPKSTAHIHIAFGAIDKAKLLGNPVGVEIVLPFKHGVSDTVVADESKKFIEHLSKLPLINKVNVDNKARVVRISLSAEGAPDPFVLATSLGINISSYVKELSMDLKFKHAIEEIINTSDTTTSLADLLEFSYEFKIRARKALLHTIGHMVPNLDKIAFLALLENLNISVALGSLKNFVSAFSPPSGVVVSVPAAPVSLPPEYEAVLVPVRKIQQFIVDHKSKQKLKDRYLEGVSANDQGLSLLLSAKTFLEQVSQVNVFAESGVTVTLDLHDLILFKLVPNKVYSI